MRAGDLFVLPAEPLGAGDNLCGDSVNKGRSPAGAGADVHGDSGIARRVAGFGCG